MYRENALKKKLLAGEPALACWLHLASPVAAEIVSLVGYDGAVIDLEHGPVDYLGATVLMQAMSATPISSIIRVPCNDPVEIKRALDTGVEGIMVPNVDTPEAAQAAVAACHYPPQGVRGVAHILNRASSYGLESQRYLRDEGSELLVICQVESLEAVANIEKICAVDGVDMLFIGPSDLSADAGGVANFSNPVFVEALARAERVICESDKFLGGIPRPGDAPCDMFARGYDFVIAASDVLLLRDAALNNLQENTPGD
jgi:2-keto-3-deoxy-L-rhamnonate aldolase RhmA